MGGWQYNLTSCGANRTWFGPTGRRWCNQSGNMHGGAIYPDNGSSGWSVVQNVFEDVAHWAFVWDGRPGKMQDMLFGGSWTDSALFTNHAAANNVTFGAGNAFVNRSAGDAWPAGAVAVMRGAGAAAWRALEPRRAAPG